MYWAYAGKYLANWSLAFENIHSFAFKLLIDLKIKKSCPVITEVSLVSKWGEKETK